MATTDPTASGGDTSFLNSPAGLALLQGALGMGGGMLSGYGQAQIAGANRDLSLQEMLNQLVQQNYQFNQGQNLQRAQAGLTGTQLNPAAQAQGMFNALLKGQYAQNIRPSQVTAPYSLRGSVPQLSGGAMSLIPQGGLPSSVTNALSPAAVLASANQFQQGMANLNPATPTLNLGPTFGSAGTTATQGNEAYRQGQLSNLNNQQSAQTQALQQALQTANQQAQQQSSGGGFWSHLLGALGTIGSVVAAPFTAGTSLAWLPEALGAAGGVGSALAGGGGAGSAILGGVTGGLSGYGQAQHPLFGGAGGGSSTTFNPGGGMGPYANSGISPDIYNNVAGNLNPPQGDYGALPTLPNLSGYRTSTSPSSNG